MSHKAVISAGIECLCLIQASQQFADVPDNAFLALSSPQGTILFDSLTIESVIRYFRGPANLQAMGSAAPWVCRMDIQQFDM